jgi:hypothetical protein
MLHVFVETNWLVDFAAPEYRWAFAAVELHARAARGELKLHLPTISISEARRRYEKDFRSEKKPTASGASSPEKGVRSS